VRPATEPERANVGGARVTAHIHAAIEDLLRRSRLAKPDAIAGVVQRAVLPLGLQTRAYLADHEQRTLHPLREPDKPPASAVPIDGTLAGRAFATTTPQPLGRPPTRIWLPLMDGSERLGVLEVAIPGALTGALDQVVAGCTALAALAGHLIQAKLGQGDSMEQVRRTKPMSVASEMLRQLLPTPAFTSDDLSISAYLQPAYEVGGDGYDYAVDGGTARVTIMDAVGHGLQAGLTCAAALAAMRATRRGGAELDEIARAADEAISAQRPDPRFVTAVLVDLDLGAGRLRYVNAGHPPPVLMRNGRAVRQLVHGRRPPLGLPSASATAREEQLEPGDRLLLYTDGVTEARGRNGEFFGLDRLMELAAKHMASRLPTPEILRRLSHAVYDHQNGELDDDATLVLVEWSQAAARRSVP
jgi:serine phosphatase RsbU (regulator of sigma subunit)